VLLVLILALCGGTRVLDVIGSLSVKNAGARSDAERPITPPLARLDFGKRGKRDA